MNWVVAPSVINDLARSMMKERPYQARLKLKARGNEAKRKKPKKVRR